MNKVLLFSLLIGLLPSKSKAQSTIINTGNWNNTSIWASGTVATDITRNVIVNGNSSVTVLTSYSYQVGSVDMVQNNTLTINSGGSLSIGNLSNARNLTTGMNGKLSVAGTLTIWGDFEANSNIDISVTGSLAIKGNLLLNGNANININNGASLIVGGNLTGTTNTNINLAGTGKAIVGGNLTVPGGSNLNGPPGALALMGGCSGPNSFCESSVLPVKLLFVKAFPDEKTYSVLVTWASIMEEHFDKYVVERSDNGVSFTEYGSVNGKGDTFSRQDYTFIDEAPLAGKNYYRLKSIDEDGNYEYSAIVQCENNGSQLVSVHPNPGDGSYINYKLNFDPGYNDKIVIMDSRGTEVQRVSNINRIKGEINFAAVLKPGFYFLKYSGSFERIIKISVR